MSSEEDSLSDSSSNSTKGRAFEQYQLKKAVATEEEVVEKSVGKEKSKRKTRKDKKEWSDDEAVTLIELLEENP